MAKPERFLVTGCASGIGLAVADALVEKGHRVVATDINETALAEHAKAAQWPEGRVLTHRLDVCDADAWKKVIDAAQTAFGGIDVLYNIAGYLKPGYAHEVALEDIDLHLDINTKGVMFGTRLAAEKMVAQGHGHIVNVASMAALAPIPGLALYSASKFAVRSFSIAAAIDLAPHNVAVTVVCPDAVATPMLDLQKDYKEAALTFTAPKVLTAKDVTDVLLGKVLTKRPMEVAIPTRRKWLARAADLMPGLAKRISVGMIKKGRKRQGEIKG